MVLVLAVASPGMGHWGTCPLEFANGQIDIERVVDRIDALAHNCRLALK